MPDKDIVGDVVDEEVKNKSDAGFAGDAKIDDKSAEDVDDKSKGGDEAVGDMATGEVERDQSAVEDAVAQSQSGSISQARFVTLLFVKHVFGSTWGNQFKMTAFYARKSSSIVRSFITCRIPQTYKQTFYQLNSSLC